MSAFFEALWTFDFLQNAWIGGVLASIGCGIMGAAPKGFKKSPFVPPASPLGQP